MSSLCSHLRQFCTKSSPLCLITQRLQSAEDKGIAEWILNRPEAKNALSLEMIRLIEEANVHHQQDRETRCIIVKSSVPGIFCAGADLKERIKMTSEEAQSTVSRLRRVFNGVSKIRCPTIAVLEGAALGGGAELALACDFRIGSPATKFSLPETRLGIIPGAGGTQRLPRLIGLAKAKELIFTGRALNAEESLHLGLLNEISEDPVQKALLLAREICAGAPIAIESAKQAVLEGFEKPMDAALEIEADCYDLTLNTQDRLEGLKAFKEKRKPDFKGV